jgi:hypothetical protein
MGRMMSPDPIGGDMTYPQSLNRYAYVLTNPLRFTDPTALKRRINPTRVPIEPEGELSLVGEPEAIYGVDG